MTAPASVFDVARAVADALEAAGIDYAIGGALAYGQYGIPRATNDLDINVYHSPMGGPTLLAALRSAGCELDEKKALDALAAGNDFGARCRGYRVDVYTPAFELLEAARDRAVRLPLLGRPASFLSAEDILLLKVTWHRGQDVEDIKRLVATWGDRLDLGYVRKWLSRLFPGGDARVEELERLLVEYMPM